MYSFTVKEWKRNEEIRELLVLEPVRLVITEGGLGWSGYFECKDGANWVTTLKDDGVDRTGEKSRLRNICEIVSRWI